MSKKMRIFWLVVAGMIVLGGGAIMGIFYSVNYFAHKIGEDIYGGPMPETIEPTFGAYLSTVKMGWFKDKSTNTQVVIFEDSRQKYPNAPLSPPDLEQAISNYDQYELIIQAIVGSTTSIPAKITIGNQDVKTLLYVDPVGQTSHLGILNLDQSQMLFIATKEQMSSDSKEVAQFFQSMPALKHDSHILRPPADNAQSKSSDASDGANTVQ